MVLVVLQNPYRNNALASGWNPSTWLKELWRSHTGTRLREVLPDDCDVRITNANPKLADSVSDCLPPDIAHLKRTATRVKPDVVLACGKMACQGISQLETQIRVVEMPHPAYRALSKETTKQIRAKLDAAVRGKDGC